MNTIKFEVVDFTLSNVYLTEGQLDKYIPAHLIARMEYKTVTEDYVAAYGPRVFEFKPGVTQITGNDRVLVRTPEYIVEVYFRPVVDIKSVMGEGFLIECATGQAVEGSPVIDYDYQDEAFEAGQTAMIAFMRKMNA